MNENPTVHPTVAAVTPPPAKPKRNLKQLIWPIFALVLLIALAVSVFMWKPWVANIKATDRTITVTGDATIKAEPDEFVFYPNYTITGADKQTALNTMTSKSNEITAKLKSLGVASNKIKVDSSDYANIYTPLNIGGAQQPTAYLTITVTVDDKTLAQKVQDYLLTTNPDGSVTPSSSFSTAKQKTLETQARGQAEKDARTKADQSAQNLGFKVKAVKTVEDGSFNSISPCMKGICAGGVEDLNASTSSSAQLQIQPGENDLPYSVKVTYYIQ